MSEDPFSTHEEKSKLFLLVSTKTLMTLTHFPVRVYPVNCNNKSYLFIISDPWYSSRFFTLIVLSNLAYNLLFCSTFIKLRYCLCTEGFPLIRCGVAEVQSFWTTDIRIRTGWPWLVQILSPRHQTAPRDQRGFSGHTERADLQDLLSV